MIALAGRERLLASAGVRVGGAALVLAGIVVGVRLLGPAQFGLSVLVLSVGHVGAFPLTAMERLVVRLVAQGDVATASDVLRRGEVVAAGGILTAAVLGAALAVLGKGSEALFVVASGVTMASAGLVTLRQGASRAAGRLGWGQVPNEVFRPLATLMSYPLAHILIPDHSGALSTLIASAATLVLILWAPRVAHGARSITASPVRGAAVSLMVVSIVALGVERLYPVIIGWTATATDVAIFAVVLRVIQLANFSQAFGVFYYSPMLARASAGAGFSRESARLTHRIRAVGLLAAVPISGLCVFAPGVVEAALGSLISMEIELRVAALGILANVLGSPSQTLLVMTGREGLVARAYGAGAVVSAIAFVASGADGASAATWGLVAASVTWSLIQVVMARRAFGRWL